MPVRRDDRRQLLDAHMHRGDVQTAQLKPEGKFIGFHSATSFTYRPSPRSCGGVDAAATADCHPNSWFLVPCPHPREISISTAYNCHSTAHIPIKAVKKGLCDSDGKILHNNKRNMCID
jgi:hypothetical protein